MKNNKQTAVEWLSNKMVEILGDKCNELSTEQTLRGHYALKEAKAMHKEEMIEFANDFWTETDSTVEHTNAEIFYNKIFKSE